MDVHVSELNINERSGVGDDTPFVVRKISRHGRTGASTGCCGHIDDDEVRPIVGALDLTIWSFGLFLDNNGGDGGTGIVGDDDKSVVVVRTTLGVTTDTGAPLSGCRCDDDTLSALDNGNVDNDLLVGVDVVVIRAGVRFVDEAIQSRRTNVRVTQYIKFGGKRSKKCPCRDSSPGPLDHNQRS
jgi:hypothetical protein